MNLLPLNHPLNHLLNRIFPCFPSQQAFFSRQLYYKSMLDTKNRVYQNLLRTTNGGENLDVQELQDTMNQLNARCVEFPLFSLLFIYYFLGLLRLWFRVFFFFFFFISNWSFLPSFHSYLLLLLLFSSLFSGTRTRQPNMNIHTQRHKTYLKNLN